MKAYLAGLIALATACTQISPNASAAPGTSTSPAPTVASAAGALAEVAPAAEKTTASGDVVMVGVPRFQLANPEGSGPVTLRTRRSLVIAEDAHQVSIWDAANGVPLQHIAPRPDAPWGDSVSVVVSADGEWLATGSSMRVRLFRRPFEKNIGELACYDARAFSHDGRLLACQTNGLGIWDVAQHKLVAPLPATAPKDLVRSVRFAPDDRSLVWATEHAVLRWDFTGTGAVAPIYQAATRIEYATIADGGSAAYVRAAGKAVIVDLATSKTTSVPSAYGAALAPSGQRLAITVAGAVQVIEVASGKVIWTVKLASPATRLAFGETDDAIAYAEAGRVRVATFPNGPAMPAQTARFAGWLGDGTAAIERSDTIRSFVLATRTWGPADRSGLAPKMLPGAAPTWAQWIAEAPGDRSVAAEPSNRHELTPDRRGIGPCNPKLRVWTPVGGTKALTMACTKAEMDGHEDPGWEIGGGWAVGVSATTAAIYDPRKGVRVAMLNLPPRKSSHPEFAPAYWQMALAPAGDWLALVSRRAELQGSSGTEPPDPREDAMHVDEAVTTADCVNGERGCQLEYFVELWTLKGPPKRVWRARLERSILGHQLTEAATPSGVLAFDRSGGRLVIGFDNGDIGIVSTSAPDIPRIEHLHRAAIRALSLDPSGNWVFSSDSAGEQRLWKSE